MLNRTVVEESRSRLSLQELLSLCSPAARQIVEKLPPTFVDQLYKAIPQGLMHKNQAVTFECEISRRWNDWRRIAEVRRFTPRLPK